MSSECHHLIIDFHSSQRNFYNDFTFTSLHYVYSSTFSCIPSWLCCIPDKTVKNNKLLYTVGAAYCGHTRSEANAALSDYYLNTFNRKRIFLIKREFNIIIGFKERFIRMKAYVISKLGCYQIGYHRHLNVNHEICFVVVRNPSGLLSQFS